jgi:hypothetical protein
MASVKPKPFPNNSLLKQNRLELSMTCLPQPARRPLESCIKALKNRKCDFKFG